MKHRLLQLERLERRVVLATGVADYVIAISVDGLHPDAVSALGPTRVPAFYRLRQEGAFTDNARTDYTHTVTLPNHATQLTGRPVEGANGHNLTVNVDPGGTLQDEHGSYVASVFDVVHDNGLSTALYASKSKFAVFDRSWNETHGALDATGISNGRDKIDVYSYTPDTEQLVAGFVDRMSLAPFHFSLIHLQDPDIAGHTYGWMSNGYLNSVERVDGLLQQIMIAVDASSQLRSRTAIILTTDHAGEGLTHLDPTLEDNYTIPFFVWGPAVQAGADLYALNPHSRSEPGSTRPATNAHPPPIRNGDLANLALDLLGFPAVPGSQFNLNQDLETDQPGPAQRWWQNPLNAFDVDGDGRVFPRDVLLVINALNDYGGAHSLSAPTAGVNGPPPYVDVSGDDFLAPIDALLVINEINYPTTSEGEATELNVDSLSAIDLFFSPYVGQRAELKLATAAALEGRSGRARHDR